MKKVFLLALLTFTFMSCENDDDNSNSVIITDSELENELIDLGQVSISIFTEDNIDQTSLFNAYVFSFEANNIVTATRNGETAQGSYNVFIDDGRTELALSFPNSTELLELNDDWYYISSTGNSILFQDEEDTLEFEKL
jgi:hypothetical protein